MTTWIASPLVLALKYSFKNEESKVNFSLGTLIGTTGYLNSFKGYGGLHWLSMTLGDRLNNITFSAGYGYIKLGDNRHELKEGVYYETPPLYETPPSISVMPINNGPLFSIAGIFKVGAKASFIFDSMALLYEKEETNSEYTELTPAGPTNEFTFKYTVTKDKISRTALLLMPGMRFKTSEKKAFQIALTGVSLFGGNNGDINFPFPMVSWFRKF